MAADVVGPAGEVTGLDGHPGMLEVARSATPPDAVVSWLEASADDMPIADGSFDAVLCSLGLQFFADKVGALAEMRGVLTAGGRVTIGVPGPTPPMFIEWHDLLAGRLGADVAAFVPLVFSLHHPDEVDVLLDHAGFVARHVQTHTLSLRLPPPAEFFWQYMLSTPLASAVAGLDDTERTELERDAVTRWQPSLAGGHIRTDVDLTVATAVA